MNPVPGNLAAMQRGESIAPWHSLSLEETACRLGTDLQHGLAAVEADCRRVTYGSNLLREPPPEAWWWKLFRQFREVVIWILLVAALIAGAMGDWADTAAILAIVLLNAIIGFLQEER
ncbi:MAG: cation-transporting P-type ATPase, partial [Planctomycetia bacterium]